MDINQPADWLNVLEKLSQVRSCEDSEGVCASYILLQESRTKRNNLYLKVLKSGCVEQ